MSDYLQKKCVLILASYPASLRNFRGQLIIDLLGRGHEVHVAAPGLAQDLETVRWLNERVVIWHEAPISRTGLNPFSDLATLISLVGLFRIVRPDIFIGYTIKPVIWGLIAARIARVRQRVALITGLGYSFTDGGSGTRKLVGAIAKSLYRVALKRATHLIFQNPDDREEFSKLGLLPPELVVEVVPGSGVDLVHFAPKELPSLPPRFLLIARLLGDKGIREFVSAASEVKKTWPLAQFHLVGGLDPNPASVSEFEVEEWVRSGILVWHGHLSDVREALECCHVYVLPSYREGMPRTVLEAMAVGRPIITSDAPGCRETVVDGRNGFLVPVRDAEALSRAMIRFLNEPELILQMGTRSRELVEQKFDVRIVNAQMISMMGL